MKTVLAALDNSLAARPVLATARALASVLDAEVDGLHVQTNGDRTVRSAAEAAGVPIRTRRGPVVDSLLEESRADDVLALVIGARGTPGRGRPLGKTALAVATSLLKPVVVVPPNARDPDGLRRILVPLEGSASTSLAPRSVVKLARDTKIDVLALHVYDESSIPTFTDQPQHEQAAWAQEFLARYCPWDIGAVRLETRVGRSDELIPLVAEECGCDLIALGWSQELAPGRAPVVRAALARAHVPIMLLPVASAVPNSAEGRVGSALERAPEQV